MSIGRQKTHAHKIIKNMFGEKHSLKGALLLEEGAYSDRQQAEPSVGEPGGGSWHVSKCPC